MIPGVQQPAAPQPFRAGDVVAVKAGPCAGERWLVAVYDAKRDEAWIAGWPETLVTKATKAVELVEAATDEQHQRMCEDVERSGGARASALKIVRERGGMP